MIHVDRFLFATGIEKQLSGNHKKTGTIFRRDEMRSCHHYERWREDFQLVKELGISCLRYGPPIYTTWLGEGRYDWDFLG